MITYIAQSVLAFIGAVTCRASANRSLTATEQKVTFLIGFGLVLLAAILN